VDPYGPHLVTAARREEWLWGWDPTPGIVSVWAEENGRATVWRRDPATAALVREEERFRPWILLDRLDDLRHLGTRLAPEGGAAAPVQFRELDGPGELRFLVSAADGAALVRAVLHGASRRLGRHVGHLRDLGPGAALALPAEEKYLVATGRTYFRGLTFDDLRRLQFDLETTGLDATRDRVFLIAVRDPRGETRVLEAEGEGDAAEAELIRRLVAAVDEADPDVIENHNLHGFDLPFWPSGPPAARAAGAGAPGRAGAARARRPARRGAWRRGRRVRLVAPGRELIDTLDAVVRYDFSARELPGHGLKAVARHFGVAAPEREYVPGSQVHAVYRQDPGAGAALRGPTTWRRSPRWRGSGRGGVRAGQDGSAPLRAPGRRRPRHGVSDPLLVRAYLRAGTALPRTGPATAPRTAARRCTSSPRGWRAGW
jgi:hypothetical protein